MCRSGHDVVPRATPLELAAVESAQSGEDRSRQPVEYIDLRPREFTLLEFLIRNAGKVVSKTMILSHVWGYHFDPQTNVVDVLVSRLREKIDRPFDRPLLHTVRGVGYVLRA